MYNTLIFIPKKNIQGDELINWLISNIDPKKWDIAEFDSYIINKENIEVPSHCIEFKKESDAIFFKMSFCFDI